jgi:phosphate acetyltransferase
VARSVYVTGLEAGGGKSTIALGLTELLSRRVERLAVFRPLVREVADQIIDLLRGYPTVVSAGHGVTYDEAAALLATGGTERLVEHILERFRAVRGDAEATVLVGTDFGRESGDSALHDGVPMSELAFNARLAAEFGAVVLPVIEGRGRPADAVGGAVRAAYQALSSMDSTVLAVIANRVSPASMGEVMAAAGELPVPVYAVADVATISTPTLAEVAAALHAERLLGDDASYGRDVSGFVVGAAHVPVFLDYLRDGSAVIMPGDRTDLITAAAAAHDAGIAAVAGLVLTLGERPDRRVLNLLSRMRTGLPVVLVQTDSFDTVAAASNLEGRLTSANPRKVEAAIAAFESSVDGAELVRRLDLAETSRVTPLMFQYQLIDRARADRRRVVLPEGKEERILRATELLLRRGVADLTLLGPVDDVARRARELGLDVSAATVIDPADSPWREKFAASYAALRSHRGVSLEMAYDMVSDVNYFGTLMVAEGLADAMVSGATHPTADTIRPAFEIIKTDPGVSVASSVFFMCLADRVLVYGDCAVNPDPDAAQLADIAISSAETARRFGVDPRIAMLSYSTGTSGHGVDVEKVAQATRLVRERRPDLPVEGPIQYDAAVDPLVAQAKLPKSDVAGRATVFIFPDLNTGNNTYKAVQRSAGAVAVGPVLQGLRKPVNDLSRGATVADIINTVAITAIQAQSPEAARG